MNILALAFISPLIGFILLAISNNRWSENISATIGIGSVGIAVLVTLYIGICFFESNQQYFSISLYKWILIDNFDINFNLILDDLSLTMLSIVTIVGFLIHMFSSWYMKGEYGYSRFFAYTNLFISSMIILILSDNLLLMYLGWEGTSICSYLLISFYYTNIKNSISAIKAFIITRAGDIFLVISFFILYKEFNTLNFYKIKEIITSNLNINNTMLWWSALMLLIGALGKSVQIPLHSWLVDAMVAPTPASALIHAATMVTAGVYLILRNFNIFLKFPDILYLISIIGSLTLIIGASAALLQSDIKKILAYSTMSQIGYVFLALGVKGWYVAILHLMTHSFFKALLFLASGSLIITCRYEQNIFNMGGLKKSIPFIHFCFLIGGLSLAGFPLISSGFFSKSKIFAEIINSEHNYFIFIGLLGNFITSVYIFRMIFTIFYGNEKIKIIHIGSGFMHHIPLIILLILSTFIGTTIIPTLNLGVSNTENIGINNNNNILIELISSILTILGIIVAIYFWYYRNKIIGTIVVNNLYKSYAKWIYNICNFNIFDWFYQKFFFKPFIFISFKLKNDPLNLLIDKIVFIFNVINKIYFSNKKNYLKWYISSIIIGSLITLIILMIFYYKNIV